MGEYIKNLTGLFHVILINKNTCRVVVQLLSCVPLFATPIDCSKPGFSNMWSVNFQMFKLDLEKAEEPEVKLPTSAGSSSKRVPEKHLFLLYWLCQSLCVDHNKLWKIPTEMGLPDHPTCLLRNLCAGQEAKVRTGLGTIIWFKIGKRICWGCTAKYIM